MICLLLNCVGDLLLRLMLSRRTPIKTLTSKVQKHTDREPSQLVSTTTGF